MKKNILFITIVLLLVEIANAQESVKRYIYTVRKGKISFSVPSNFKMEQKADESIIGAFASTQIYITPTADNINTISDLQESIKELQDEFNIAPYGEISYTVTESYSKGSWRIYLYAYPENKNCTAYCFIPGFNSSLFIMIQYPRELEPMIKRCLFSFRTEGGNWELKDPTPPTTSTPEESAAEETPIETIENE